MEEATQILHRGVRTGRIAAIIGLISIALSLIGILAGLSGIANLVVLILFGLALNSLSKYYGDSSLFRLYIIAVLLTVAGFLIAMIAFGKTFFEIWMAGQDNLSQMDERDIFSLFGEVIWASVLFLLLSAASVVLVGVIYIRLGDQSGLTLFKVAGWLCVLIIPAVIGIVLGYVGWLMWKPEG